MTLREFMEKAEGAVLAEEAKCGSAEELREFFVSRGVSVSDGEAEKLYALLFERTVTELSDEELHRVAGGLFYYPIEGCPRGLTKRYVLSPATPSKEAIDPACELFFECEYLGQDSEFGPKYCKKQGNKVKWDWSLPNLW